ncbi:MAG: hypothetical protein HQ522_10265 [Bacteroidetes bacterium]|nr:hypothetical protein [Bacteroidota bacterium]
MRNQKISLLSFCLLLVAFAGQLKSQPTNNSTFKSIQQFDILPGNSAETNQINLQKAIDWAAKSGAALFVDPVEKPYEIAGGIVLKKNVSLIGVHGPVPRGTKHPELKNPVGSVFAIRDQSKPFITVESSTQIKGIQFWYPEQTMDKPDEIIEYPATIQVSKTNKTEGVTLKNLTFYGEYLAMDFNASQKNACELILIEHCHGYPLSGEFIRIDYCYDIPRILHCHVNPAIQRQLGGQYPKQIVDAVVAKKSFTYAINHTDNAQLMDVFTFGAYGGIYLGPATYGQLTNFNLDCVTIGIHKLGDNKRNRNWMIAQGSIIANTGDKIEDIHPILVEGMGHTALSNVEAFSGDNGALTNLHGSWDFMTVRGKEKCTVSIIGCRMRNYASENPLTIENPNAKIQAIGCFDGMDEIFNITINN